VYAVAAALTILVLDRLPQGGDQIKQLLVGDVLAVTPSDVARTAGVYAVIGVVHWLCRRPLLARSFGGQVDARRGWDVVFYSTFGAVLAAIATVRAGITLVHRTRRDGPRALAGCAAVLSVLVALAGAFLVAAPNGDHPWLDAIERIAPPVLTVFLTSGERAALADSRMAIALGSAELARLRALEADVQFGTRQIDLEQRERLRQFLAGRGE